MSGGSGCPPGGSPFGHGLFCIGGRGPLTFMPPPVPGGRFCGALFPSPTRIQMFFHQLVPQTRSGLTILGIKNEGVGLAAERIVGSQRAVGRIGRGADARRVRNGRLRTASATSVAAEPDSDANANAKVAAPTGSVEVIARVHSARIGHVQRIIADIGVAVQRLRIGNVAAQRIRRHHAAVSRTIIAGKSVIVARAIPRIGFWVAFVAGEVVGGIRVRARWAQRKSSAAAVKGASSLQNCFNTSSRGSGTERAE